MNDEILDDFKSDEKSLAQLWKYRVVGVFRLLIVFILTWAVIGSIVRFVNFVSSNGFAFNFLSGRVYGSLMGFILSFLALIYHSGQVLVELRSFDGFSDKRRFRGVSIFFSFLIAAASITSLFPLVQYSESSALMTDRSIIFILLIVITIILLVVDFRYSRASRK